MKTQTRLSIGYLISICVALFLLHPSNTILALQNFPIGASIDTNNFTEYYGKIIDGKTGRSLAFANLMVVGTNVSTVTNSDGEFSLKIFNDIKNPSVVVSFIGYKSRQISLNDLTQKKVHIKMEPTSVILPEVSVISKDAEALFLAVMKNKGENYFNTPTIMTAFYREAIKKNRSYVSLSEAIVEIYKQSYTSGKSDIVKLYKARKNADYSKLDTITFKLQGGPFNSLYLDIMKNPDLVFTEEMITNYEFSFDRSMYMDKQLIYVLDFKQRPEITKPLYYGKLYIDAQNLALKSAVFKLDISNRREAASLFVIKKPHRAKIYPYDTNYRIDYREKDGKWYYGYSRIEFGLKINWKRRLFNTNYFSTLEMAVTDWKVENNKTNISRKERLNPKVIISDEASGFTDNNFWGEYNVIEPEKSIESAIKKIQKRLDKE